MNPSEFTDTVLSNTSTLDKVAFFDEFAYGYCGLIIACPVLSDIKLSIDGLIATNSRVSTDGLIASDALAADDSVVSTHRNITFKINIPSYFLHIGAILDEEVVVKCFDLLGYVAGGGEGSIGDFRFIAAITRCCYIGDCSLPYDKAVDELGNRLEYRLAHDFDFGERF